MTKVLTGLSKNNPYLAMGGKIKPREIDQYLIYAVQKPAIGDSAIVATTAGTATAGTVAINYLDYPRNLSVKFVESSGTAWNSTVTIYGKDQFGNAISEDFSIAGDGTITVHGTKVFDYVGTVAMANASGAAGADDMAVGYCSADGTTKLGLPTKVSGSADIKRFTWLDNGASKQGTATVDTTFHAIVTGVGTISNQDDYIFWIKPNYVSDDNEMLLTSNPTNITNA